MADINLSKSVRSNLTSLQNTAQLMNKTSDRLSSGNKVNSALDNPTNFFTASQLNSRAGDLNNLMDSMANGIKTIEAADNGLKAITKTIESMQGLARQARQDKSQSVTPTATAALTNSSDATNSKLTFDLGKGVTVAIDAFKQPVNATVTTLNGTALDNAAQVAVQTSTTALTVKLGEGSTALDTDVEFEASDITLAAKVDKINAALLADNNTTTKAVIKDDAINFVDTSGKKLEIGGDHATALGFADTNRISTNGKEAVDGAALTADELAKAVNASSQLSGKVKAVVSGPDNARVLKFENLTSSDINVSGLNGAAVSGSAAHVTPLAKGVSNGTSDTRMSLKNQFTELKTQLESLAKDAGFNGINLLQGDKLKLNFNETGTSSIEIQGKKADGNVFGEISVANLGLDADVAFNDDEQLDGLLSSLGSALSTLRTQATTYGTALSTVQNRQDFTRSMINTLETGAGNLTLADMNQEAANMMALQTRQSLASSTLSMANQADQGVLQLLR